MHNLRVRLLDLGFLELDVLARDRIVFLEGQLVGLGAGVLLGDVEIAGVGGREQLDLERGGLGHGETSFNEAARGTRQIARATASPDFAGKIVRIRAKSSRSQRRASRAMSRLSPLLKANV